MRFSWYWTIIWHSSISGVVISWPWPSSSYHVLFCPCVSYSSQEDTWFLAAGSRGPSSLRGNQAASWHPSLARRVAYSGRNPRGSHGSLGRPGIKPSSSESASPSNLQGEGLEFSEENYGGHFKQPKWLRQQSFDNNEDGSSDDSNENDENDNDASAPDRYFNDDEPVDARHGSDAESAKERIHVEGVLAVPARTGGVAVGRLELHARSHRTHVLQQPREGRIRKKHKRWTPSRSRPLETTDSGRSKNSSTATSRCATDARQTETSAPGVL